MYKKKILLQLLKEAAPNAVTSEELESKLDANRSAVRQQVYRLRHEHKIESLRIQAYRYAD